MVCNVVCKYKSSLNSVIRICQSEISRYTVVLNHDKYLLVCRGLQVYVFKCNL